MKKVELKNIKREQLNLEETQLNVLGLNEKTEMISDGYHTFGELYKHRFHLYIALCKLYIKDEEENWFNHYIIKSKEHYDGYIMPGWFIIQMETEVGQISYHLPNKYWDICSFIESVEKSKKWDGHNSDDVLERLLKI